MNGALNCRTDNTNNAVKVQSSIQHTTILENHFADNHRADDDATRLSQNQNVHKNSSTNSEETVKDEIPIPLYTVQVIPNENQYSF